MTTLQLCTLLFITLSLSYVKFEVYTSRDF